MYVFLHSIFFHHILSYPFIFNYTHVYPFISPCKYVDSPLRVVGIQLPGGQQSLGSPWTFRFPSLLRKVAGGVGGKVSFEPRKLPERLLDKCWVVFNEKKHLFPGIPTTIKTMGLNITTIVYLRVLIIQIGSTIISMVVEAQGIFHPPTPPHPFFFP